MEMKSRGTTRERRWAVVTLEGHHSWVGREIDPTPEHLAEVAEQLAERGLVAWLAVTQGVYYQPSHTMTAVMVRPLAGEGDWEAAWAAFLARRADRLRAG